MIDREERSFLGCPVAVDRDDLGGSDAVIIGAPYAEGWVSDYAGILKGEWLAAPKRVRQQSIRYPSGYVQDLNIDVFEHLRVLDYGNANIPSEVHDRPTVENILRAQASVEQKFNDVLDAEALPIVIGQNSPLGSYAIAKPIGERTRGNVGVVSLDAHWDALPMHRVTTDPRIAGGGNWKEKLYRDHANYLPKNLVEIGERGMLKDASRVRKWLKAGTHFYAMWKVRSELGIEGLCDELRHAYEGTESVYGHFDLDVLGGAGGSPGDLLGGIAEPIGMTDYEVIRIAHEVGKRGCDGFSFICIPPGSALIYRTVVYIIMYLLAGMSITAKKNAE